MPASTCSRPEIACRSPRQRSARRSSRVQPKVRKRRKVRLCGLRSSWRLERMAVRYWEDRRMLALSDLSHDLFLRWAREAGVVELSALLLWRWDAEGQADAFPDSADAYCGSAQTILYGLRAGDDVDRFLERVRANQ